MEGSSYSNVDCDKASVSVTPSQKQELLKFELLSLNTDLPPSCDGDNSSVNEGCESPLSSWDLEPETDVQSIIDSDDIPDQENYLDMEEQNQFVGVENTDDGLLWEMDNRSYEELLKKFIEKEEELRVSNFKLQFSEQENIKLIAQVHNSEARLDNVFSKLKTQVEKSENRLNNVNGELKRKEEELKIQKELSEEEIFKLKIQIEKSELQLKLTQENMAKSESELVSEKRQNQMLGDLVKMYEANETNKEQEVQKLKSELLDSQAKFSFDIADMSKMNTELTSKLKDYDSRNKVLKIKLGQYKAEKLKQVEHHATKQKLLQDQIMSLRQEQDEANVMIADFKAEICSRDDKISNMKKYTDDVKTSLKALMVDYDTAQNEVNNLKLRVGEVENVVTRQNGEISDMAMGKKEAVRQLHYYESQLELYKAAYNKLFERFVK